MEELFVRMARILRLTVRGIEIQTTAEHPFFVLGHAWLPANELQAGDFLATHDGAWVRADAVDATEAWGTVYNLRVHEDHTYFVGKDEWGFAVWAHNSYSNFIDKLSATDTPDLRFAYESHVRLMSAPDLDAGGRGTLWNHFAGSKSVIAAAQEGRAATGLGAARLKSDAWNVVKLDVDTSKYAPIDLHTLDHIFTGEIRIGKNGVPRAVGFHYEGDAANKTHLTTEGTGPFPGATFSPPDRNGSYQYGPAIPASSAHGITVKGVPKPTSSMFPEHFEKFEVLSAIDQAWLDPSRIPAQASRGRSTPAPSSVYPYANGILIQFYMRHPNQPGAGTIVESAFPRYGE